jgi:hypothetical protein
MTALLDTREACNALRFREDMRGGHYESYFQRANHPSRPLAFWIRYTLLVPRRQPDAAVIELWAIYFDGERGSVTATKQRHPLAMAQLGTRPFTLRVGSSSLEEASLRGAARSGGHHIGWALDYSSPEPPLLLLPERLYSGGFPKAKSLVGSPNARYRGALEVDGVPVEIDDWIGSQNHNWGERHTDLYAWGQVAGFDEDPTAFLECASARVRVAGLRTPWMSVIVLRLDGVEHRLNALWTAAVARADVTRFDWRFESALRGVRIEGRLHAPREAFVALRYDDPPGGHKLCMNSKIAACELRVERPAAAPRVLHSRCRAAFELLTNDDGSAEPVA